MPLFEMMQVEAEINGLVDVFQREGVTSYLEIGSKFGGSLWKVGASLPYGSRIVSVDLPGGTRRWKESEQSLKSCINELQKAGYDAHVIWGNSTDAAVVEQCRAWGPYDAILLDGDHTRFGVFRDWENYSPMGRLIAFHDIAWFRTPTWAGVRIDVPELWNYLRAHYKFEEWRFCPTGKNNGIGVIWREQGFLPMGPDDPSAVQP